jgi:hypothetical protein
MNPVVAVMNFFAGARGPLTIGLVIALIIVALEWRVALLGLFFVQIGVVSAAVVDLKLPSDWAGVMVVVMGLSCLILAMSAQRITRTTTLYQSGTWQMRALLLAVVYVGWELAQVNLRFPQITPQLSDLFVWLALCILIQLGLSSNPLFSTVALLMSLIAVQIIAAVLVNSPSLLALIGTLTLLLALAGSYLVLVEQVTVEEEKPVVTDITFPSDSRIPAPPIFSPSEEEGWVEWLRRQSWGEALLERTRQVMGRRP